MITSMGKIDAIGKENNIRANDSCEKMEYFDTYFSTLNAMVRDLEEKNNLDMMPEEKLEAYLFSGTDGSEGWEELDISNHPVWKMNILYKRLIDSITAEIDDEMVKGIADAIAKTKYSNRRKINMRRWEEDYRVKPETMELISYKDYGCLTNIQNIRIIEKIENEQKRLGRETVRVAFFGELDCNETEAFDEYFGCGKIKLQKYMHEKEYWFYKEGDEEARINLRSLRDVKDLLQSYDLVLFLDESYFYKQYQSHKTVRETHQGAYIAVYKALADKYTDDNPAKINAYYSMYEETRKYLANRQSEMSAAYEYDVRLIKILQEVSREINGNSADIYLYINNNKIADQDISDLNVCKDEFYDGKNLVVYKIEGNRQEEAVAEPREYAGVVNVDLWKLIKSISNDYYYAVWKKYQIKALKEAKIGFAGDGFKEDGAFYIRYSGNFDAKQKSFVEAVFKIIQGEYNLECVKSYLINLLSNAILTRANNIEQIVMAYFVHKNRNVKFEKMNLGDTLQTGNDNQDRMCFKQKKLIFTIIEKLDEVVIRDFQRLMQYLMFDFKLSYASEVQDDEFIGYLKEIADACKLFGDEKSRIYIYSSSVK